MPIWSRKKNVEVAIKAVTQPTALVAAATRLQSAGATAFRKSVIKKSAWQPEAWRQFDLSGELRYATTWMANSLSRIRLYVAEVDSAGRIIGETKNKKVLALTQSLLGNPVEQAQIMYDFGINLGVAGDAYLIGLEQDNGDIGEWLVASTEEISDGGISGGVQVDLGDEKFDLDLSSDLAIRVHQPHPRRWSEADSATRGALPILREMEELSKYVFAVINSRLAGAGILLLPSEISFPAAVEDLRAGETPFMASLAEAMLTPIGDPGDPSAVVPIVVQAPKDAIGGAQWLISPASDLTTVVAELREAAIRRLALALDLPPEVLLGQTGESRWSGWQTEESSIKIHIEPKAILVAAAITKGYLKPLLEVNDIDPKKYVIWIDTSELVQRPNRGTDAKDLWDRGIISDETLRNENGFAPETAPKNEELCRNLAREIIRLAPRFAEDNLKVALQMLGADACGVNLDEVENAPNPDGGTPRNDKAPGDNVDSAKPAPVTEED